MSLKDDARLTERSSGSNTHVLSQEETRQILTPFAFEMDKSLFGSVLASPTRRAVAILLDLIVIAMLADMPWELLATVFAFTLYGIGSKKRALAQGKIKGFKRRALLRFFGIFVLFSVLINILPESLMDTNVDEKLAAEVQKEVNIQTLEEAVLLESTLVDSSLVDNSLVDNSPIENTHLESLESEIEKNEQSKAKDKPLYSVIEWFKGIIEDLGLGFGWAAFYFTAFTALYNGQTLGKKLLGIKVLQLDGSPLSLWDSFGRYGGYGAGLATGLLGFMQIYWDANRQAIQDKISTTVVINIRK